MRLGAVGVRRGRRPVALFCCPNAADDHDHPPAGDRPRLPAAQAPGAGAVVRRCRSGRRTSSTRRRRDERCTAALLLDVDPVGLVRGTRRGARASRSSQYVNDRPYVASSFLSVAIAQVFGTRAGGPLQGPARSSPRRRSRSTARLAVLPVPRRRGVPARGCSSRSATTVDADAPSARRAVPGVGRRAATSRSTLRRRRAGCATCSTHLYVLVPVLDDEKHYWVGDDEVEKLLRHGEGWLAGHPERELIAGRYLKHQRGARRARRSRGWSRTRTRPRRGAARPREAEEEARRGAAAA